MLLFHEGTAQGNKKEDDTSDLTTKTESIARNQFLADCLYVIENMIGLNLPPPPQGNKKEGYHPLAKHHPFEVAEQ